MNPETEKTQPIVDIVTPQVEVSNQISQPESQVQSAIQAPVQMPVESIVAPTVVNKQRHFLAVFFLSFLWGAFGADRFYLGKIGTGFLKLITFGGFGLWALTDLALVMNGAVRDKQGNEMLEFEKYKKFANRTVLYFSLVVLTIVVATGAMLTLAVMQFMQGGGLQSLIPSATGGQNVDASQLQSLMQTTGL